MYQEHNFEEDYYQMICTLQAGFEMWKSFQSFLRETDKLKGMDWIEEFCSAAKQILQSLEKERQLAQHCSPHVAYKQESTGLGE